MTIIVFLIDTSASMYQRAYLGGRPTLLDMAKGAVETFVKVRQRIPDSRGDRYMLLTFEDPPHNIKAGWKENLVTFMNELKNLQCQGMTTMGPALKHAFDVLNINRMQTGIDTYGQGRSPFYLEPSVIVVITDGGRLSNLSGVQDEFNLPMHSPTPGCELTREPFRWDQRLFALVLRLSGTPAVERDVGLVPSDSSPIDAMCEVTGGRSYSVTSQRMLHQCIDSLVQKVQSGVVINFEKIGPDPPPVNADGVKEPTDGTEQDSDKDFDKDSMMLQNNDMNKVQNGARHINNVNSSSASSTASWQSCRKLIYVPRSAQKGFPVGFWPIPESFWPDLQSQTLPPRSAHPNVKFTCTSQDPMVIENLPFDKYELEPSPLTQFILARKQPTVCWQVFVTNSYKNSEMGHPFGYLKASTNLSCVNLFVMPYNYPVLLPLLDELFKVHRQKQTPEWRAAFANYLKTMPSYYAAPLRRALQRMGATNSLAQNLVPDSLDNCMSYSVLNYLKRLKNQAKIEYEKLCNDVSSKQMTAKAASQASEGVRVIPRCPLKRDLLSHPMLQDKFQSFRDQLNEFGGFVVGVSHRKHRTGQSYRNAFDIQRRNLASHILRMRANLLTPSLSHIKLLDDDVVHSMPISQMGNYQEHLKKTQPSLREVESAPVRQHMFGNPFKIDKRMMVDEADIDLVGGGGSSGGSGSVSGSGRGQKRPLEGSNPSRPNKRKPGPIPANVKVRRPLSPLTVTNSPRPSPPSTPVSTLTASAATSLIRPTPLPSPSPPLSPSTSSPQLLLSGPTVLSLSPPLSPTTSQPLLSAASSQSTSIASSSHAFKAVPPRIPQPPPNLQVPTPAVSQPVTPLNSTPVVQRVPSPPPVRSLPSPPPLINGDLGDMVIDESEGSRSPSPTTLDSAEFAPPPVLQPYDGGGAPGTPGGPCPPSYSVTPPLSPPALTAVPPPEPESNDDDGPVSSSVVSSRKELAEIRKHNLNVRALAYKEVRRPGRNYDVLFEHLETMKGPTETKIALLKEVINESLRFKRRALASHLDKQLKALAASPIPNHKGHNGSR